MSPKNKGKFGKGKSAVEPEDEFVSTMGELGKRLKPHVKKIVIMTTVFFLALGSLFTWRWWDNRQEAGATAHYRAALLVAQVPVFPPPAQDDEDEASDGEDGATSEPGEDGKQAAPKALPEPPDKDNDGIADEFYSNAQRAAAVMVHLDKLYSDYDSTDVAAEASYLRGTMLLDLGRFADARDSFRKYASDGSNSALKRRARAGMGAAMESLAMASDSDEARTSTLKEALEAFRKIQTSDKGPGRDLALYHEARILAALGERDQAIEALEKALEVAPDGDLRYDIDQRLVLLRTAN